MSKKEEKKETIFDHNVTPDELRDLIGFRTVDKENLINTLSQTQWYAVLYSLYMLRGNKNKASFYASKIPDTADKIFGLLNHDFYR